MIGKEHPIVGKAALMTALKSPGFFMGLVLIEQVFPFLET